MATRILPTNYQKYVTLLQASITAGTTDQAAGKDYLDQALIDACTTLLPAYQTAQAAFTSAKAAYHQQVGVIKSTEAQLRASLRRLWSDVRWQVRNSGVDTGICPHYQLSLGGRAPYVSSRTALLTVAQQVVQGSTAAEAAGYPAIPSADTVQSQLAETQAAITALQQAHDALQAARATKNSQQDAAKGLCRDVVRCLDYRLAKLPAQQRRQVLRRYGVQYAGDSAEEAATTESSRGLLAPSDEADVRAEVPIVPLAVPNDQPLAESPGPVHPVPVNGYANGHASGHSAD